MKGKALLGAIGLAVFAAACGGGGHGSLVPVPKPSAGAAIEKVKFSFTVPNKTTAAKRHNDTIDPGTQSLGVTVNSGTQQVFNATPASPGCSSTTNGTTCTVNIDAPVGSDTFLVNAYSGTNATGAILDSVTMTATIVQDLVNQVTLTLGPVVSTAADSGPGSLRQAIADANPGDTITFLLTPPATITLATAITLTKNVTISGPSSGTITVSGNSTSQIFVVAANTIAAISNLTLTGGANATGNGGAIDDQGSLTLSNVSVTNSVATAASPSPHYGGGIAVENSATLNVTSSTISGNSAFQGGGIWTSPTAFAVSISNSTLSNNTTTDGAGQGDGGALFTYISMTLTNDTVTGNTGSAIATGGGAGVLTISGGTYSNNTAGGGSGGALYLNNAASITGATFSGNSSGNPAIAGATNYGGAIYDGCCNLTIDSSHFTGNTTGQGSGDSAYGGAISLQDGNLTITGSTFQSNVAGSTTSTLGEGGAIDDATFNTMAVTGSTFTSNQAIGTGSATGGAVYLQGTLTANSDTYSQNSATAGTGGTATGGAAAYYNEGTSADASGSSFSNNSATAGTTTSTGFGTAYGGALSVLSGGGVIALDNSTFSSNSAFGEDGALGGALDNEGSVSMTGGSFTGNTATAGVHPCGPTASGGAAYVNGSSAAFTTVTFSSNHTLAQSGIGVCLAARPRAAALTPVRSHSVTHKPFVSVHPLAVGSSSGQYGSGGAIDFVGASLTLSGVTISGNSSLTDGGGISTRGTNAAISNSTISSNTVTNTPGTIDGGGGIYNTGVTGVTGSTISGNTVSGSTNGQDGGGGIDLFGGSLSMTNDTVTGNTAVYGGDFFNYGSSVILYNVTVMNGTADATLGSGGDYYGASTDALSIFGSIFAGGTAFSANNIGGTIYTFTDNDYNIINTGNGGTAGTGAHDVSTNAANPKLLALASNGGPTQTMADQSKSPGVDAIPLTTCAQFGVITDQRGNARGDAQDATPSCDIGSYEFP